MTPTNQFLSLYFSNSFIPGTTTVKSGIYANGTFNVNTTTFSELYTGVTQQLSSLRASANINITHTTPIIATTLGSIYADTPYQLVLYYGTNPWYVLSFENYTPTTDTLGGASYNGSLIFTFINNIIFSIGHT